MAQAPDEGIEDVGNGGSNNSGIGHRSRVGFVLEGTIAVMLEFGEDMIGRGCGVRRLVVCLVVLDRHGGSPALGVAAFVDEIPGARPSFNITSTSGSRPRTGCRCCRNGGCSANRCSAPRTTKPASGSGRSNDISCLVSFCAPASDQRSRRRIGTRRQIPGEHDETLRSDRTGPFGRLEHVRGLCIDHSLCMKRRRA